MGTNQTTPLCSDTTKQEKIFDATIKDHKKVKMTKPSYAYKVNVSLYNVVIFHSFRPDLHLKNT